MAAEIISRELLEERKIKEMSLVESNLALDLKNEKQQAKEVERKTLAKVEQSVQSVRVTFNEEQRKMNDLREEQTQLITEQINGLQGAVKDEQNQREQAQNNIIRNISARIDKFSETFATEKKVNFPLLKLVIKNNQQVRLETESFLFRKIEEISSNLHNQVINERERREKTESQMLALLDEACNRFESRLETRNSHWRR